MLYKTRLYLLFKNKYKDSTRRFTYYFIFLYITKKHKLMNEKLELLFISEISVTNTDCRYKKNDLKDSRDVKQVLNKTEYSFISTYNEIKTEDEIDSQLADYITTVSK